MSSEVTYNNYIQPACLPDPSLSVYPTRANSSVWAAGWGDLSFNGNSPSKLMNVKMTYYDGSMCSLVSVQNPKNWTTQICAGEYAGGKDTCQGWYTNKYKILSLESTFF